MQGRIQEQGLVQKGWVWGLLGTTGIVSTASIIVISFLYFNS
jgi:hypothetical protein